MPGRIEGAIVAYGDAGNLITDISNERLAAVPAGSGVAVKCDEHETVGVYPAGHSEAPMTLLAIRGTSGFLELTIVGDSAKAMLGVSRGEKVIVMW